MENEIKVNDFVRLKNGRIVKVKDVKEDKIYFDSDIYFLDGIPIFEMENIFNNFIVKHSPNLIDLIQCGDYVNGHLVIDIPGDESGAVYLEQITKGALIPTLKEDIRTIVTKEMMESISYKVTKM